MINKPKGTYDILPGEIEKWQELESIIYHVSQIYNFKEIRTPIFEQSDLFHRGVGDTTDIVKKETYDFVDRGGRTITLRPEGTAGVVRSVIENKLYASAQLPLKYYYYGPIFRYERPQKGRQRQFNQFGAEALGEKNPLIDAEMIAYAYSFLKALRLPGIKVRVNSLGDTESKETYHKALKDYLKGHVEELCNDCQRRYDENPYRVLDCKVDHEKDAIQNAPKPIDYLNTEDKDHFDKVLTYLDDFKIPYIVDPFLVRGLDYYTNTVFELEADVDTLGAQSVLGGGGRYNHLVETLDGPAFSAVGFAFGVERLLIARESLDLEPEDDRLHAFMIVLGEEARKTALETIIRLRHGGLTIDYDFSNRNLKGQFKQAERLNPRYLLILGEDEAAAGMIQLKDNQTGVQETVSLMDIYQVIVYKLQHPDTSCSGDCSGCSTCQ